MLHDVYSEIDLLELLQATVDQEPSPVSVPTGWSAIDELEMPRLVDDDA